MILQRNRFKSSSTCCKEEEKGIISKTKMSSLNTSLQKKKLTYQVIHQYLSGKINVTTRLSNQTYLINSLHNHVIHKTHTRLIQCNYLLSTKHLPDKFKAPTRLPTKHLLDNSMQLPDYPPILTR